MIDQIKAILEEGVLQNAFPGGQFCLLKDGSITCESVGYKALYPEKIPNDGHEIYDIASLTKVVITTTLIMQLVEKKLLHLDDKVSVYLPQFMHKDITIYHLLTHTSGMQADIFNASMYRNKRSIFNTIYSLDKLREPGEYVIYSDINYLLLGEVIETVSKQPLDTVANENIFNPLSMHDTSFRPDKNRCAPTERREDEVFNGLLQGVVHDEKSFALNGLSGHAGCFSTAYDLSLFMKDLLHENKLLSKDTVHELFKLREQKPNLNGFMETRALGFDKPSVNSLTGNDFNFDDIIIHTGFTGCHMIIDRSQNMGFVLLTNAVHPKRELNQIKAYRQAIGQVLFDKKGGTQ